MPKKKILVTTSTLPRFEGDPEPRFVLDLCKALQKIYDLTILAPADPKAEIEEFMEGVKVIRYRYFPHRNLERLAYPGAIMPRLRSQPLNWVLLPLLLGGLYRSMRNLLKNGEYSCVHSHWLIPQGLIQALFFSQPTDPPYVVTSHGGDVHSFRKIRSFLPYEMVIKRAAAVSVVSKELRGIFMKGRQDEHADKIQVIPMGVDPRKFNPKFRDEKWARQKGLSRPVILFVGRLAEKKGLKYLLQAMATNRLKSTRASLAIVGDGPLRDALEAEVKRLKIKQSVCFLGSVGHEDLKRIYASSDLFCTPSIIAEGGDHEGMPTVLCEAAASGLPAIGTQVGGIPEIIRDGITGHLVPPGDVKALSEACFRYIISPEARASDGKAAMQWVKKFSWKNLSDSYAQLVPDRKP